MKNALHSLDLLTNNFFLHLVLDRNAMAVVSNVYEIHRYQHDIFQCVVARTNKYNEEQVKKDIEKMNAMLSEEAKSEGIRYVFAIGSMSDMIRQRTNKIHRGGEQQSSSSSIL